MTHSLDPYDAPEPVKQYYRERKIRPGDRIYLRALPDLTAATLWSEYQNHHSRGLSENQAVVKIASKFKRTVKTIRVRLKRLRNAPGGGAHSDGSGPSGDIGAGT